MTNPQVVVTPTVYPKSERCKPHEWDSWLCGLCQAEPAGDILERPAGEVAEEGDHGGKDRQCEKCIQRRGKAAHALAAASCVITLERFDRLVRQLGRAGTDELALIICQLSMRRMGQYIAAKRKDGPCGSSLGFVFRRLRRPGESGRGPSCGCRGRHTSPGAGASRSRRCGRRARRACCTRCPV